MHRAKLHVVLRSVALRSVMEPRKALATVGFTRVCEAGKKPRHVRKAESDVKHETQRKPNPNRPSYRKTLTSLAR